MKTWLTYLAAAAMGLAFELTFKNSEFYLTVITFMADVVLKLGIFIVFPLAFFTMTSGTASLTRKKRTEQLRLALHNPVGNVHNFSPLRCRKSSVQGFPCRFPVNNHITEQCTAGI